MRRNDQRFKLYERTSGGYYRLTDGNDTFFEEQQVAILLDMELSEGRGMLLKHGVPSMVETYFNKMKAAHPLFESLVYVVLPPDFPVEELNHMLECTGYIPKDIREAVTQPPTPLEQPQPIEEAPEPSLGSKWAWLDEV